MKFVFAAVALLFFFVPRLGLAQECILEKTGGPFTGSSFLVKQNFGLIDGGVALAVIQAKMEASGQKILAKNPAAGTLNAEQPGKSGGTGLPIVVTLKQNQGQTEASVSIKLAALQLTADEAVKNELCSYLSGLSNLAAATPAVAAAATATATATATSAKALSDNEFSKNGMPCLDGICIGDDITQIRSVNWTAQHPIMKRPLRTLTTPEVDLVKAYLFGPDAAIKKVAAALNISNFDASAIAALAQVETACNVFQLSIGNSANFISESGHVTSVFFQPTANKEGTGQTYRVNMIIRQFEGIKSQTQANQLEEALNRGYAPIVNTHALSYSKQALYPTVTIKSSIVGPGKPTVILMEPAQDGFNRPELLKLNPKCGGAKPVKLN
jgi:hypothetical protein